MKRVIMIVLDSVGAGALPDADKYGDAAVRKNLTIPAWLNTFAVANHINFSEVLKDSLTALYLEKSNA